MATELSLEFDWRSKRFYDASVGLNAFATALNKQWGNVAETISTELRGFLEDVATALEKRHGQPYPGGTSAKTLSRRSGFLVESLGHSVKVEGSTISTIVGTITIPGQRKIHENGGVLKPKRAKYLTIPLPAALNANGTPKKPSARDWANTFVLKSRAGNLLIVQKQGTQIIPLYVLNTEVYIPPRLGVLDTLKAGQTMLADRLTNAILKELQV